MPSPCNHINLDQVEVAAPGNGFGERWEARVARTDLDAEEVYVVLRGSGRVELGDELIVFGPHHADGEAVEDDWVS